MIVRAQISTGPHPFSRHIPAATTPPQHRFSAAYSSVVVSLRGGGAQRGIYSLGRTRDTRRLTVLRYEVNAAPVRATNPQRRRTEACHIDATQAHGDSQHHNGRTCRPTPLSQEFYLHICGILACSRTLLCGVPSATNLAPTPARSPATSLATPLATMQLRKAQHRRRHLLRQQMFTRSPIGATSPTLGGGHALSPARNGRIFVVIPCAPQR